MPLKKVLVPDMPENTVFFVFFGVALVFLTLGSPSSRYKLPEPFKKIPWPLKKILGPDIPDNPLIFLFTCRFFGFWQP